MFKKPRIKDEDHLQFIRSLPCATCGNNTSTEAAHLRTGDLMYGKEHTGGGQKPSDKWTTPLCGICHRDQHKHNEWRWWREKRINPFTLSMSLYHVSGDHEMACTVIERHRNAI